MSSTMRWVVTEDGDVVSLGRVVAINLCSYNAGECSLGARMDSGGEYTLMRFPCYPCEVLPHLTSIMEILLGSDTPGPVPMYTYSALLGTISAHRPSPVASLVPGSDCRTNIRALVGIKPHDDSDITPLE